ncbi:MAG: right-handed parallel beta-helix repeat-containing protein [bacterium]|nr:right-handed parallel beta-helix repeat-containing protein [bacterium]
MSRITLLPLGLATALLLAATSVAWADPGVLEINATCAINSGCFAGDGPGYPVQITPAAPAKSFVLTSDLVPSNLDTDGIEVLANDVSIDLGGFAILGGACVGTNADCSPPGGGAVPAGDGIDAITSPPVVGLAVTNGRIVGMGRRGIDVGQNARISNVEVRWNGSIGLATAGQAAISDVVAFENGSTGVAIGSNSTATRVTSFGNASAGVTGSVGATLDQVTARGNDGSGISVTSHTTVRNSTSTGNGDGGTIDDGISCGAGSMIVNNAVEGNTGDGIDCQGDSTLIGNAVRNNDGDGIECDNSCTILDSSVVSNGDQSGDDGISCGQGCNVRGNTIRGSNFGNGISLGADSGYANNVVTANPGAGTVSGGVNSLGNLCNGGTCP